MTKFKKILITIAVGLLITFLIALFKGLPQQTETIDILHTLCDAFFVAGVLLMGSGMLVVSSNLGAFEMIVYGMTSFIDYFRKKSERKYETFYDYHIAREKNKTSFWFLLIIGGCFLVVSLIFLWLYEIVK